MTRYLLDTNHAGATLRGDPAILSHIASLSDAELAISLPGLGELWFMVLNSVRQVENATKLRTLIARFRLVGFGIPEAEEFGRIRVELRQAGRPIPQIDVQIAAIARVGSFVLVTSDTHFQHVVDLKLENWTQPTNP